MSTAVWTQLSPAANPTVRRGHGMCYDATNDELVMFGGYAGSGVYNETWCYNFTSANWSQKSPATVPPALWDMDMAWDSTANRVLMFGGGSVPAYAALYNHLYGWDGSDWTVITADGAVGSPSKRYGAAIAFDSDNNKLLLFGGSIAGGTSSSQTWECDLSGPTWTQLTPASNPEARRCAGMCYNPTDGKFYLYGGRDVSATYTDVWTFDGTNWTEVEDDLTGAGNWFGRPYYDSTYRRSFLVNALDPVTAAPSKMDAFSCDDMICFGSAAGATAPYQRWQFGSSCYRSGAVYVFGGGDILTNGGKNDLWYLTITLTDTLSDDLSSATGGQRRYCLAIDGVEYLLWSDDGTGTAPASGFARSGLVCLRPPTERSMELDLGEMMAGLSQMTFELEDVKVSSLSYFGQLTAPNAWEYGEHVRVERGTASLQQIDADATTIPIVGNVTDFPSSGTAYIGNEAFSYTGVTDDGDGTGTITGVQKGLDPCVPLTSGTYYGRTFARPAPTDSTYQHAVAENPFTIAGRRCALYVTTWNRNDGRWNDATAMDSFGPIWVGRISHNIQWNERQVLWRLNCTSIVDELKEITIGQNMPEVELAQGVNFISLSESDRTAYVWEYDTDGNLWAWYPFTIDAKYYDVVPAQYADYRPWAIAAKLKSDLTGIGIDTTLTQLAHEVNQKSYAAMTSYGRSVCPSLTVAGDTFKLGVGGSDVNGVAGTMEIYGGHHIWRALGFDNISAPLSVQYDDGDVTPLEGEAYFQAYQPLTNVATAGDTSDGVLITSLATACWADQGDGPDAGGYLSAPAHLVARDNAEITHFFHYGTRVLMALGLYADPIPAWPCGYVGHRVGDEPVRLTQTYLPSAVQADGSTVRGPYQILLEMLCSTGTSGYNGTYDVLPKEVSCGIQERLIDTDSFIEADAKLLASSLANRGCYPVTQKPVNMAELIKREAKLFGMPVVWSHGKLRVIDALHPDAADIQVTLDDSNTASSREWTTVDQSVDTVVNEYEIKTSDPRGREKYPPIVVQDMDSSEMMSAKRVTIEHPGIWVQQGITSYVKDAFRDALSGRFLRFPSPVVERSMAPYLIDQIYPGDCVQLNTSGIYDLRGSGTFSANNYGQVLATSWNHETGKGKVTLRLFAMDRTTVAVAGYFTMIYGPWGPSALVDRNAANGGWDSVNYQLTLSDNHYGPTGLGAGTQDASAFSAGDKVKIIACANSSPSAPVNPSSVTCWSATVSSAYETDGDNLLTLDAVTLTGWDTTGATEYVVVPDDYDTAVAAQKQRAVWAADSDTFTLGAAGYLPFSWG